MNKTCKQCEKEFEVADWDIEFLRKLSPTFDGKQFLIPSPTLCPDCRRQRRMVWRNNQFLFSRKCDLCAKDIISTYSTSKPFKVYCADCWWSDKWSPIDYGRDFNPEKSFFEQMAELIKNVPRIALMNKNPENSDYCNYAGNNKNCYLAVAGSWNNENCLYGFRMSHSKDCVDCFSIEKGELCYQIFSCHDIYHCFYCNFCSDCSECYFSVDLKGCDHCIFSNNLRNKSYYAFNKPCTKEEFEKLAAKISDTEDLNRMEEKFKEIAKSSIYRPMKLDNCENCEGDDLLNSKNAKEAYYAFGLEDVKYFLIGEDTKDSMDCSATGVGGCQLFYESMSSGVEGYNNLFTNGNWTCSNTYYCETIFNSKNCFGCVNLRKEENCILNKKYTSEEYEKKVAEIIEQMQSTGEWGEFFPVKLGPYGYNETFAQNFHPLSKEQALELGAEWQEDELTPSYPGPFLEVRSNIDDYINNPVLANEVVKGAIKCESTGKPFRIMPQEMAFYLKTKIALPKKHYNARFDERLSIGTPRKLWERECMCEQQGHGHDGKCSNKFKTSFSPDGPEKVYCESCYQKAVL